MAGLAPGIQGTCPRDDRPEPARDGIDPAIHGPCPRGHAPEPTMDARGAPVVARLGVTIRVGTRGARRGSVVGLAI